MGQLIEVGGGMGWGWDRDRWGETGWMLGGVGIRGGCGARDREGWVRRYATYVCWEWAG